jgi:hypothetical protein
MSTWENDFKRVPLLTFPEYLATIDNSKKKAYQRGYDQFMDFKWTTTYELLLKKNETQITTGEKVKPRLLLNPTDCVKGVIGWTTHNLLLLLKANLPEFVHGMTCHQLADYFENAMH